MAALLLLAGCGEDGGGPIAVSAIGPSPRLVNPNREPVDTPSALLMDAAAQGLVRFDAGGEIEPGLAQRWVVSDDGLRYTFRLRRAEWPDGRRVTAEQVAARLKAAASPRSANRLKPILGAIDEIVAMTDDVLEISLRSPRPNFLQLLAQPEMALLLGAKGTGPYRVEPRPDGSLSLSLPPRDAEEADSPSPPLLLRGEAPAVSVARFRTRGADLVTGGSLGDLPVARAARPARATLRFDPAQGLLGLAFVRPDGSFANAELRQAIAMTVDRAGLVAAFAVPGWAPRESLLPPGVEGLGAVSAPAWIRLPLEARRATAAAIVRRAAEGRRLTLRVAVPEGPGWRLLFARLRRDWAAVGIAAFRVEPQAEADLRLVDEVAPAALASWYLRRFTCEASRICDPVADERLAEARLAPDAATRRARLAEADRILAGLGPFITLAAPVRWSLVAPRLTGFRPNPFARHPVGELVRPSG
ncbi:MAG TPA: ABC transporter substrate-binding protein [Allosphingosinicella sp.]|nr:ABC transporter substrate-binding protein [Allosphingosinicella sp.]